MGVSIRAAFRWVGTNGAPWISLAALIVAIGSPFITYYKLDMKLQELKHMPRLKYDEMGQLIGRSSLSYSLRLTNTGDMPATGIKVVLVVCEGVPMPDPKAIKISPPVPFTANVEGRNITLDLRAGMKKDETHTIDMPVLGVRDPEKLFKVLTWAHAFSGGGPEYWAMTGYVSSDQGAGERAKSDWMSSDDDVKK